MLGQKRPRLDELIECVENGEDVGFCTSCGEDVFGVEMDARDYECPECKQPAVFGAEDLLLQMDPDKYHELLMEGDKP